MSRTTETGHENTVQPAPPVRTGQEVLAWLLDPISQAEFESKIYEKRLCFVNRNAPRYYGQLLSARDLDTVLCTHAVSPREVNLVKAGKSVPHDEYVAGNGRIDPRAVAAEFDDGATVIFGQLQRRVPALAQLCTSLGRVFGSRVQTNVYLTPPDAQGFSAHWDTHDVFVLQISGRKRWSIHSTETALPLRGQNYEGDRDSPGPVRQQFELGPGSVAYIPRGLVHSANATSIGSLHITLGLTSFTWTDLFLEGVAAAALEEEVLRQNLPIGWSRHSSLTEGYKALYKEKLDVLLSRLDPAPVWTHFRDQVAIANMPVLTDLLASRIGALPLTLNSRMKRRVDLFVEIEYTNEHCVVRLPGQDIRLPRRAFSAVEFAITTREFRVGDLPDCLDSAGKIALVNRLVKAALLVPETGDGSNETEGSCQRT